MRNHSAFFMDSLNVIYEEEKTFRTMHKSHSYIVITLYGGGECRYVADEKLFTRSSWMTDFPPTRRKAGREGEEHVLV